MCQVWCGGTTLTIASMSRLRLAPERFGSEGCVGFLSSHRKMLELGKMRKMHSAEETRRSSMREDF